MTDLLTELDALLVAVAAGDRVAFARLYDATGADAFGLALRAAGSRDDAERIVEAAYLELWRSAAAFDPGSESAREWILALVRRRAGLAQLTPAQQEVLALASFAGCTQDEIARRLGHPVGEVKTRMREALTRLRELSEEAAG